MADWIEFSEAYVLAALPSDVRAAYDAWLIANPDKDERLAAITGQVLADFRSGLSANPNVVVDPDTTMLHQRCVLHAQTCVVYHLTLEMGLPINTSAQTAFNNAQVYLRRLYQSDEVLDAEVSRTPSYVTDVERPERRIS